MPYRSTFYPEHHLFYETLWGSVTLEEIRVFHEGNVRAVAEAQTPIHILVDVRDLKEFPTSIVQMKDVLHPIEGPNLYWMILITNNGALIKFIGSIVIQLVLKNGRFRLLGSLEEALAFLEQADSTLDLSDFLPELAKQA